MGAGRWGRPGTTARSAGVAGALVGGVVGGLAAAAELVWRRDCMCCGRPVDTATAPAATPTAPPRAWSPATRAAVPASTPSVDPATAPAVGPGAPGLCRDCARALSAPPDLVTPVATAPPFPVLACGPYGGAHRMLVLAAKDHLRRDAVDVAGACLGAAVRDLTARGLLPVPGPGAAPVLVAAPTRRSAARNRGGDVVSRMARAAVAGLPWGGTVAAPGRVREGTPDSVGQGRAARRRNTASGIVLDDRAARGLARAARGRAVVVVDDVLTTGATVTQFALALAAAGVRVDAAVVVAAG
ncbi:phosphoribosyltransferase family protein [Corynebacterium bovis]|uniref:Putative amidophosphoribosyltransferase n=1 Tax=Corynebacterium bovis DSM 20582 = CIP 54.80 TaxID=927655 RepID=A0A8H9YAD0_9CORY|nr:phosphoribosyltransferase family protein [Corynebacterium bovis]MBB3115672.1 putative amidophosphoribosyltransferase [Corynebacterium bovis DSM 20582 = CIP 54.80]RRQ14638.1 hypothetical protein CXF47_02460 [Corynebacterium bovis]WJY77097.1 Orotate phosphoribosyltransferase [Corynebacterium bovis DSM 20582 = CIP 54.80]